ncbi:Growth arrest and DNA damage-inducible proteins-interacting protein 1 [Orchesella cincta]|uniref:Large ribosomal subunit protein mL64 n=1 Tax=Orchesella cincta TaxID=48709 RepID=A0A1D2N747_ORCCI|nr:Growth arrest and DNA damage-inducible proteins-interacting protein 1 [Orchesella cincta]
MSRALERLTFLSGADYSSFWTRRSYSAFRRVGPLNSKTGNCSQGSLNTLQDVRMCITSQGHHPLAVHHKSKLINVLSNQNQRSMSILTDLLRRKKRDNDDDDDETIPEAKTLTLIEESPAALTEEEIEAKRNISRLSIYHQRLVNGQHPYPEPMSWVHHTVRYKQKMFGQYGESSGVNPGILWPTHEELQNKKEFEEISNPYTIQEMVEIKLAQRKAEKEAVERRIKFVEERMKLVDQFKEDLRKRLEAKEKESNEAKARKERLVEEVRRHFGYTVDSRDERFQEMLAKKEKEDKKKQKEARKLEKEKRALEKLQGKSTPEKSSKKSEESTVDKEIDKDD